MGGTLSPASSVWAGIGSWSLSPGMTSIGIDSIKRTVSPGSASKKCSNMDIESFGSVSWIGV